MRQAISPRLAMRIFSNIRRTKYQKEIPPRNKHAPLQRDIRSRLFRSGDVETDKIAAYLEATVIVKQIKCVDLLSAVKSGSSKKIIKKLECQIDFMKIIRIIWKRCSAPSSGRRNRRHRISRFGTLMRKLPSSLRTRKHSPSTCGNSSK